MKSVVVRCPSCNGQMFGKDFPVGEEWYAGVPAKPTKFKQWQIKEGNRIYKHGAGVLSNTELLAHVLRDQKVASNLLERFDNLKNLAEATLEELKSVVGVGQASAERIQVAFELGHRVENYSNGGKIIICQPQDVYDLFASEFRQYKQEVLKVLLLDVKCQFIKAETVSMGIVDRSLVHPREVYHSAIRHNAFQIILAHNHVSGDPAPSGGDIQVTKQIKESGNIIDISLIDHIIIGDGRFVSLKEQGSIA